MSRELALTLGPLAAIGRNALGVLGYLGGLGILIASAARSLIRPRGSSPSLRAALARQWDWLFGMGLPLVALVHVGLGSFLAMQAFYGAVFLEAVGPLVTIGLFRNLAPLVTGLTMAGLFAARVIPELRADHDDDPGYVADRAVTQGLEADPRAPVPAAYRAGVRLLAAAMAGPVLVLVGSAVGITIGCLVARAMLGVPTPIFFSKAREMLWVRDVYGLIGKGFTFALAAMAPACFEGLRGGPTEPAALRLAVFRSACLGMLGVLLMNYSWFTLLYFAGPPFGRTVLIPPTR